MKAMAVLIVTENYLEFGLETGKNFISVKFLKLGLRRVFCNVLNN